MTLQVLRCGALTTVQDLGRDGWRHIGVARAGALDPTQAALANRLVGNAADAAVLELTLQGPTLAFASPIRIALCGAEIDAHFEDTNARGHEVPHARPVTLPAGVLTLGTIRNGLRAWLAVAGGIDVPRVLGSRSTDLRGGFGGYAGRALQTGDCIPVGKHADITTTTLEAPAWWIELNHFSSNTPAIRYVPANDLPDTLQTEQAWTVDPRSNRQGLRCAGEAIAHCLPEQCSAPVAPGTIQLPPDGRPIVLLADAQTIGGYPRLGHVIAADLPRLTQLRAGDALRFLAVDSGLARTAMQRRRNEIARLEWMIDLAADAHHHPLL